MNTPSIDPDKLARTLHKPEREVMKTEREEYVVIGIEKKAVGDLSWKRKINLKRGIENWKEE